MTMMIILVTMIMVINDADVRVGQTDYDSMPQFRISSK